jgi:hypothetical protein
VSRFGQRRRGHLCDVADVDGAHPRVPDRREELAVLADRAGERRQALEVEVGPQERRSDPQLADPPLDGGVVAQEAHRGRLVGGQLRELDQVPHIRLGGQLGEPLLLRLRAL